MGLSVKKLVFLEVRGREIGILGLYGEMGVKLN